MPPERSSGPQRRCSAQAARKSTATAADPLDPGRDPGRQAVPPPGARTRAQGGERQAGEQRPRGARRHGHRRSQRDQAAHRQGGDPARRPVVGGHRRHGSAGRERDAQQAQQGEREQGEADRRPGHAVRQLPGLGRRGGRLALHHQHRGAPEPHQIGAGHRLDRIVHHRPAGRPRPRERQGIRGEADAGGHPPGPVGVAERLEDQERHGAEARLIVEVRARELLRQLVEQPLPRPGDRHAVRIEQQQGPPPLPFADLDPRQPAERLQAGLRRLRRDFQDGGGGAGLGPQVFPDLRVLPPHLADALLPRRALEAAGGPAGDQRQHRQGEDRTADPPLAGRAQRQPDEGEDQQDEGGPGVRQQRGRHQAGDQEDLGEGQPRRLALVRHFGDVLGSIGKSTPRSRAQAIASG